MALSSTLTALAEYVADCIVNDCGRPVPDRVLVYTGNLPHDCCSENGFLAVSWTEGHPSNKFPSSSTNSPEPCSGAPVFTLTVRYVTCWLVAEADSEGVAVTDEQDARWNADSLMLADVADCVLRSLQGLACNPVRGDSLTDRLLAQVMSNQLRNIDVTPIVPQGGCAGVQWRLYCGVRSGPVTS